MAGAAGGRTATTSRPSRSALGKRRADTARPSLDLRPYPPRLRQPRPGHPRGPRRAPRARPICGRRRRSWAGLSNPRSSCQRRPVLTFVRRWNAALGGRRSGRRSVTASVSATGRAGADRSKTSTRERSRQAGTRTCPRFRPSDGPTGDPRRLPEGTHRTRTQAPRAHRGRSGPFPFYEDAAPRVPGLLRDRRAWT